MTKIAGSVLSVPRSGIRHILERAGEIEGSIKLAIGEPLFPTPANIVEAGKRALDEGQTKYTPNAGMPQLRDVLAREASNEFGSEIVRDNVIVGAGAVEVINCAFRTICEPGDEILIPDPAWPDYAMMTTLSNTTAVGYELRPENDFQADIDELEGLITSRTKILVVNSPSNPLGVVFDDETMRALVDLAARHGILLLSDEAYEKIVFDGEMVSPLKFSDLEHVVVVRTFSKSYAMTGWRVGYLIGGRELVSEMTKLQEAYVSSVFGVAQMAAIEAIEGPQDALGEMLAEYRKNRDMASQILTDFGIDHFVPQGAFYLWINVHAEDSLEFAERLLAETGVAVAPGNTFGASGNGWVRVSLASPTEDVREGMTRLGRFLND